MISDFSGIIFDYAFLCNKPIMYVNANLDLMPYDAWDLKKPLWQFEILKKMGIELKEEQFTDIKNVIQAASDSPALAEGREEAKRQAWMYIGESGKRVADYMIQKVANT